MIFIYKHCDSASPDIESSNYVDRMTEEGQSRSLYQMQKLQLEAWENQQGLNCYIFFSWCFVDSDDGGLFEVDSLKVNCIIYERMNDASL